MNELKAIAKKDKNAFLKAMDDMYELILNSSEHTGVLSEKDRNSADGRDVGPVLARGYIDMVPLNCFYDESAKDAKSRFIYYDQEFYWENCPNYLTDMDYLNVRICGSVCHQDLQMF